MKQIKYMLAVLGLLYNLIPNRLAAQSLAPQVIASAGAYESNATGSLSYTIGETNTQTLTSGNMMLTQGFQQPYQMTLNLKAFIQGYYQGGGYMANVLYNEGITGFAGMECDTLTVQLRMSSAPYALVSESKSILQTNGQLRISGTAALGQSYYVVLKHRHALETWSANPVLLSGQTTYDFTTGANKAYGDNQIEVEPGIWALYSGDINQEENIDLLDASVLETDITNFQFGYITSDLNGDGNVDLLDSPVLEANVNGFIYAMHP